MCKAVQCKCVRCNYHAACNRHP